AGERRFDPSPRRLLAEAGLGNDGLLWRSGEQLLERVTDSLPSPHASSLCDAQAVQPRFELGLAAKSREVAKHLKEHLLRGVLEIALADAELPQERGGNRIVAPVQVAPRGAVSLDAIEQRRIDVPFELCQRASGGAHRPH